MEYSDVFYIGTNDNSFRSGEPGKITGITMLYGEGIKDKPCFEIEYGDGVKDYSPICDSKNYKLVSGDKITSCYKTRR